MKLYRLAVVAILSMLSALSSAQEAGQFPNRPVKIVVGSAPGGGTDTISRILAQQLTERFGQSFIVENRSGASGVIAGETVYRAKPDGYTLLTTPGAAISLGDLLFKNIPYPPRELESVSILTTMPLALVVRSEFPAKDFKELLDYIRKNPSKVTIASNGLGAASHLTAELFMQTTGTKLTHIPYKGTNPVLNDLLPGHVDMTFIPYGLFYELHKAQRVRILAIAAKNRLSRLPDIPTMDELGHPQILSDTWNILSAPPGTPPEVLNVVNRAVESVLSDPKVQTLLANAHMSKVGGSPADAKQYVSADREHWGKIIKAADIKPR